jgi:hypothetical protein
VFNIKLIYYRVFNFVLSNYDSGTERFFELFFIDTRNDVRKKIFNGRRQLNLGLNVLIADVLDDQRQMLFPLWFEFGSQRIEKVGLKFAD